MIEKMQDFSRNLVLRHAVGVKDDSQLLRIFLSSQDAVVSKFLVGYERAPFFFYENQKLCQRRKPQRRWVRMATQKQSHFSCWKFKKLGGELFMTHYFVRRRRKPHFFFHFYYHELKTPCMLRRINETRDRNLGNKWIVILSKSKLF